MKLHWLAAVALCTMAMPIAQARPTPGSPSASASDLRPLDAFSLDMSAPECTVAAAWTTESAQQSAVYAPLLEQQLKHMQRWEQFMNSRAWKPNVPMGEQMTSSEATLFGNLQEQSKIGVLAVLMEAKRERDIRVFAQAASLAERMAVDRYFPSDKNSEEYFLSVLLAGGREAVPFKEGEELSLLNQTGNCTLERALIAQATRASDRATAISGLDAAKASLDGLSEKYGKPVDRTKLTTDEKLLYDKSVQVVEQIRSQLNLYMDLLFLARLEQVSKLQRDVRRASQYESPGDNEHVNNVWARWMEQGKITLTQGELSRVLNYVNEKVPTDFAKPGSLPKP